MSKKFTISSTTKFLVSPCQLQIITPYKSWKVLSVSELFCFSSLSNTPWPLNIKVIRNVLKIKLIILVHCVSLFANSNSLNLFCLSESAVCDNFFWSQNEFQNEFWNCPHRLLSWNASSGPDSASQASTELHQGCCVLYYSWLSHLHWHHITAKQNSNIW